MKKLTAILLALCLCAGAFVAFVGCDKCEHPETQRTLKSTTATCTEAGVETYYCKSCGGNEEQVEVEAYGHDFLGRNDLTGNNYRDVDKKSYTEVKQNDVIVNRKCFRCEAMKITTVNGIAKSDLPELITVRTKTSQTAQETTVSTFAVDKSSVSYAYAYDCIIVSVEVEQRGSFGLPDVDDERKDYYGYVAYDYTVTTADGTNIATKPQVKDNCYATNDGKMFAITHSANKTSDGKYLLKLYIYFTETDASKKQQFKVDFTLMSSVTTLYKQPTIEGFDNVDAVIECSK